MARRIVLGISIAVGVLLVLVVVLGLANSGPKYDEAMEADRLDAQPVAPVERALTLARIAEPDAAPGAPEHRLLLVRELDSQHVRGVDLASALASDASGIPNSVLSDPIDAYHALGYEALAAVARSGEIQTFPVDWLVQPAELAWPHIAVGTNFRAHAEEAMLDGEPFLFPKLSRPTPWNAPVPTAGRLDYEAELCALTLSTIRDAESNDLGFVLCNDFTDRWTLVSALDFDEPMGTTGFADAKGKPGFLPIGALLVIPRDRERFLAEIDLELFVNDRLRQRAPVDLMVWNPSEILRNVLDRCDQPNATAAGPRPLTDCDGIPARTLIPTGTPSGVMFHPANLWLPSAYLGAGDRVVTIGTHLGWLENVVTEPSSSQR